MKLCKTSEHLQTRHKRILRGNESQGTNPTQRASRCMPLGALQTRGLAACIICTLGICPFGFFDFKRGRGAREWPIPHTHPPLVLQPPCHSEGLIRQYSKTLQMNKLQQLHTMLWLKVNSLPARPILASIYYTDWREEG